MNVHGSIVHNGQKWEPPKCPPTNEWISKMWDSQTMEYFSTTGRNKTLTHTATWMNLDHNILGGKARYKRLL
jgi:hypothetical protein